MQQFDSQEHSHVEFSSDSLLGRIMRMLSEMQKHGFSKQVAFRALTATGFHSVRSATYWLCSHIEDPLILSDAAYDFFVFLCPEGDFHDRLVNCIHQAQFILQWNSMFDFPVHLKILHFEAPYVCVPNILLHFQNAINSFRQSNKYLSFSLRLLEDDSSSVGYQLLNPQTKLALDGLLQTLVDSLNGTGTDSICILSEQVKSDYRMCLAQGQPGSSLPTALHDILQACLGKSTQGFQSIQCTWSLRLYSRDQRLRVADSETFEMLATVDSVDYITSETNDVNLTTNSEDTHCNGTCVDSSSPSSPVSILSYHCGDHVLLTCAQDLPGRLGHPVGLNLNTGRVGHFNLSAGRRVPQWHTWLLHSKLVLDIDGVLLYNDAGSLNRHSPSGSACSGTNRIPSRSPITNGPVPTTTTAAAQDNAVLVDCSPPKCASTLRIPDLCYTDILSASPNSSIFQSSSSMFPSTNGSGRPVCDSRPLAVQSTPVVDRSSECSGYRKTGAGAGAGGTGRNRQLFVMRHAERVDYCFGRSWVTQSIDRKGVYRRKNMNLPPWLPPRENPLEYAVDSPITQVGLFTAAETGRCLAEAQVNFTACYSSPALRCVQTACELLRAMHQQPEVFVRLEPHLFEYLGWYDQAPPRFLSPHDLRASGYHVDVNYKPISDHIDPDESIAVYYRRSGKLVKQILASHKSKTSCILIVGHASSLDACTNQLIHNSFRRCLSSHEDFYSRCAAIPYCSLVVAEEARGWRLIDPPIPTACAYNQNKDISWRHIMGNYSKFCGILSR